MIRNIALAAGFLAALAAPAFADCAEDITKVQQALETAQISDEDKEAVNAALADASSKSGDEEACGEALAEAKDILGIES